jgi:hypothetical protein
VKYKGKMAPHLNEFKGACSEHGRYKIELLTEGCPTARELRNVMKMLEITAAWLEEDELVVSELTDDNCQDAIIAPEPEK